MFAGGDFKRDSASPKGTATCHSERSEESPAKQQRP